MLRNYIAAALRNVVRNKLYAGLNVAGLALGLSAALLALLFVRQELSYDRFIPGHERILVVTGLMLRTSGDMTPAYFKRWFEADFPGITLTRLAPKDVSAGRNDIEAMEKSGWADPNFFTLMRLPTVAGDLGTALDQPDGLVVTRRVARKYFGRDDPIGETLNLNREHLFRITAVIEDLPSTTHLAPEIYGSARNLDFGLVQLDQQPAGEGFNTQVMTYILAEPAKGTDRETLQRAVPDFLARNLGAFLKRAGVTYEMNLVPVADLHLWPNKISSMKPHGSKTAVATVGGAGLLIVFIAVVNFAGLATARASRRAVEVGVRKTSGATVRNLMFQLLGETAAFVLVATTIAVAAVGLILPAVDTALAPGLAAQWMTPFVLASIIAFVFVACLLGGFYPAFVLASLRPATVLKGKTQTARSTRGRAGLVALQFSVLILLAVAVAVINGQTVYSLRDGLRVARDQILVVYAPCRGPFADELRRMPGVTGAACSNRDPFNMFGFISAIRRDGTEFNIGISGVGPGYFEVYGVRPVAGRLFAEGRDDRGLAERTLPIVVLNETAVRELGFASPEEAVGRTFINRENRGGPPSEIIGVVPDFIFDLRSIKIPPIIYVGAFANPNSVLNVKLTGQDVPETLDRIDALWKRVGEPRPMRRQFVEEYLQTKYIDVIRQQGFIGGLCATAIVVASLGLFGLSASTTEQRIKEIGVRKSMGATRTDILRLLLWQFAKPVIAANIIAWPAAYLVMQRWLEGFAYHINLELWMFLAASGFALVVALATVIGHALLVARAHPVDALRYE